MQTSLSIYQAYMKKIGNRLPLYKEVAEKLQIKSAIYPGSHVDITPSIVIPKVTYIDNFKGTIRFFSEMESIHAFLDAEKQYLEPCEINFLPNDYSDKMKIDCVDLIISQYAGFVGQATKKYLKKGGFLLCNDSHGDATFAKMDPDFEFIGVIKGNDQSCYIDFSDTNNYFRLPKNRPIDITEVHQKMMGPNYILKAENYLFKKIN